MPCRAPNDQNSRVVAAAPPRPAPNADASDETTFGQPTLRLRAAALRSTALSMSLVGLTLLLGLSTFAGPSLAKDDAPESATRPAAAPSATQAPGKSVSPKPQAKAQAKSGTKIDPKAKIDGKDAKPAAKTAIKLPATIPARPAINIAAKPDKKVEGHKSAAPARDSAPRSTASLAPPPAHVRAALPPRKPAIPSAVAATSATPQGDKDTLQNVIDLIRKHRPDDATQAEAAISDPVARKLAEWLILRSDSNNASVERYRAFISANPSWPSQTFLRRRMEAALWDDKRDDALVWSWFDSESPVSSKGRFALARAMMNRGDRANAERLVREAWRSDAMSESAESAALDQFGALLAPGDHKARMDTLLYLTDSDAREHPEKQQAAMRAAKRLGSGYVALAKLQIGLLQKASNSRALLEAVPSDLHSDIGYLYSKIQLLRREEKITDAAQLMLAAPRDPSRLFNPDVWWVERRLLARKLLDTGENRTAYQVARDAALPVRYKTEQEFTAGWIALRFLNDPNTASQHFARVGVGSSDPTALARGGYWQGRAAEAAGRTQEARTAYTAAAEQSTSYYGQLARAKLGLPQLDLNAAPRSRGAERLEIVRAAQLLYELDEGAIAIPIFSDMGENGDPEALIGLAEIAGRQADARAMLMVGKQALNRGLPFDHYAYPVNGIPQFKSIGPDVEQSVIFAIARQESAFNQADVSHARAYGLMQVTPDAGRYVCKRAGVGFDLNRLQSDPVYNTAVGAAELGGLLDDYRGSYIMAFAGYNAGRGSVSKWVERYGDPRDPRVDAVDWVESIPFSETRNYVQRVMENLQVYRARFGGSSRLQIEADLHRGTVQ